MPGPELSLEMENNKTDLENNETLFPNEVSLDEMREQ